MNFHSEHTYTARKQHRCGETGTPINPGDRYTVYTGICEGYFFSEKMHERLSIVFDRLNRECWMREGEGLQFGSLSDEIFEGLADNPTAERIADAEVFISCYANGAPKWMMDEIAKARAGMEGTP